MSDLYSIPKTCTRTCSIFRNIHTVVRSFSKNRCWSEWESHGDPVSQAQSRPSLCGPSVFGAARCEWTSIGLTGGRGDSHASALVVETFAAPTWVVPHHPFLETTSKSSQEIDLRYHGGKTAEISIVNPAWKHRVAFCVASKTRFALGCFVPAVKSSSDHEPS